MSAEDPKSRAKDGSLDDAKFRTDENFGFAVPVSVPGVDSKLLDPRSTWDDKDAYDRTASKLMKMFIDNFAQYESHVSKDVLDQAIRLPA